MASGPIASRIAVRISGWVSSIDSGDDPHDAGGLCGPESALPSAENASDGIVDVAGVGVERGRNDGHRLLGVVVERVDSFDERADQLVADRQSSGSGGAPASWS